MVPPTSNSPPPPWEPPSDPWHVLPNNDSNVNATGRVWALPANTGESIGSHVFTQHIQGKLRETTYIWNMLNLSFRSSLCKRWPILSFVRYTITKGNIQGSIPPNCERLRWVLYYSSYSFVYPTCLYNTLWVDTSRWGFVWRGHGWRSYQWKGGAIWALRPVTSEGKLGCPQSS